MESFIGFVYPNGFNFAPRDYTFCAGQIIPISSNQALFALLGATFGGDGRTSLGVPDLRGRAPVGCSEMGTPIPPLSPVRWGERGGLQYITLSQSQMPTHNHTAEFTPSGGGGAAQVEVTTEEGNTDTPVDGAYLSRTKATGGAQDKPENIFNTAPSEASLVSLGGVSGGGAGSGTVTVGNSGASSVIDIQNPYTGMCYVMAIDGIFPSRN